jgi:hypothetical protein
MNFLMSSCAFAEDFGKAGVKGRRVASERSDLWIIESGPRKSRQGYILITKFRRRGKQKITEISFKEGLDVFQG